MVPPKTHRAPAPPRFQKSGIRNHRPSWPATASRDRGATWPTIRTADGERSRDHDGPQLTAASQPDDARAQTAPTQRQQVPSHGGQPGQRRNTRTGHTRGGQLQLNRTNGEKRALTPRQANGGNPQPHLNEANGEQPESARAPRGGPGGRPRTSTADHWEAGQRPANSMNYRVGEEGFEPSRPFGHTDLNRARLPFRHPPRAGSKASTPPSALIPRIRSDASSEGRCHGGSSAALRAAARGHGRGRLRTGLQV